MLIQKLKRKDLLAAIFYITVILIFCMAILFLFGTYFFERHFESPIHTQSKIILDTGIAHDSTLLIYVIVYGFFAICVLICMSIYMLCITYENFKRTKIKSLLKLSSIKIDRLSDIYLSILFIFITILSIHGLNSFISESHHIILTIDN